MTPIPPHPAPGSLKRRSSALTLVLGLGLVLAGAPDGIAPAWAQTSADTAQLLSRIERLERDLRDLKAQIYRGGADRPGSDRGGAAPVVGGNPEYMTQRADQLEEDIRKLTGRIEELQFTIDQNAQRVERLATDTDYRLKTLEGGKTPIPGDGPGAASASASPATAAQTGAAAGPTRLDPTRSPPAGLLGAPGGAPSALPPAAPAAAPAAPATSLPGGTPEEQYNYAFGLMRQGDYAAAEAAFKEFIARNPKHERAGNADYWLGESYYVRGNYQAAAGAYLDTVQTYGAGPKGPDALLKLGMALALLGEKAQACSAFKAMPTKYPKADSGIKERAKLEAQRAKCG